jgi:hypothetical protein
MREPLSCDTSAALGSATVARSAVFAEAMA